MRVLRIISTLLLFYTANVSADLSIRYDAISDNQRTPFNSIMIKRELVRINQMQQAPASLLINLQSGDIVQLHEPSKRFFRINAATIDQYASFYKSNRTLLQGMIDQGLTQLSPEQREQIKTLLAQYRQPSATTHQYRLEPTPRKQEILGVECQVVAIMQEQQLISDICISDYRELGLRRGDMASLEQFKGFIQQFSHAAPPRHQYLFKMLANSQTEINGLPMQLTHYRADGKVSKVIQAGSISLRSIPNNLYRIPSNFKQNSLPLM